MDEKFHEQAAALEQASRDVGLQAARRALQGQGQARCKDCQDPIAPERRKATPNAIRCVACQTIFEKLKVTKP